MAQRVSQAQSIRRRHCYFSGRVQGVGFRYTAQNIAMQHNVHGYVRNCPDGRVELLMEGPEEEMTQLLDTLRQRMNPFIRKVDCLEEPATGEYDEFQIRH